MKLSIDELTRLAFIYAEQDRASLADSYGGDVDESNHPEAVAALELANKFRAYRLKRWGKTALDVQLESMVPAKIQDIASATPTWRTSANPDVMHQSGYENSVSCRCVYRFPLVGTHGIVGSGTTGTSPNETAGRITYHVAASLTISRRVLPQTIRHYRADLCADLLNVCSDFVTITKECGMVAAGLVAHQIGGLFCWLHRMGWNMTAAIIRDGLLRMFAVRRAGVEAKYFTSRDGAEGCASAGDAWYDEQASISEEFFSPTSCPTVSQPQAVPAPASEYTPA